MFEKDGRIISLEEAQGAADIKGMSVEQWAAEFGFTNSEGKPGKTNGSTETLPIEPVNNTAAGDSSSADISLESPNFDLTADLQSLAEAGVFKGDETEGRKRLEGYFKNVAGLSFEEKVPGMDYIQAIYTDPNTGKKTKSDFISFDTKNEKALAKNVANLTSFVNGNISQENLAGIATGVEELKAARKEEIAGFATPESLAEINTKFDNPELFTPYMETENITPARSASPMSDFQSVSAGTREVEVRPYEAELSTAAKDISLWAEENGADLSPEAIAEGAQDVVRGMLRAEALLDVKQDAAKAATKDNIEKEGDQFVGDVFLQKESAKKYDAILEKAMSAKNQVETSSRAYNKLAALTKGELSMEEQESLGQDLKNLGIAINSDNQNIVRFEDGTEMPEEYFKALEATSEIYDASTLIQKEEQNKSSNAAAELEDINTAMDASRRSYDLADKSLNTIATGSGNILLGAAMIGSYLSPLARLGAGEEIDAGIIQAQKGLDATREIYQRDISFEKAFNSSENFGEFMLQEVSTQIPILVTMVASGGAASVAIGVSSAGEKMIDMKTSNLEGTTDYSQGEIMLKSAGYGIAEAAFSEITTTRILRNIKADWAGAGKTTLLDNGVKAFVKDKAPALLFEPIAESLGEIGTTGTQNLIDGVPIITGMDHSAFSGYAMGLAMQVIPFVHGGYISRYSDYNAKASIRKKQTLVNDIGQRIAAENDPLKKVELEQQYVQANKELTEDIERQEDLVNNNVRADFGQAIIDITAKQSGLQTKAAAIQNDKSKSNTQKKTELAPLQAEFDILQAAKESSLSTRNMQRFRPEFDLLEQTDRAKYDRINDEAVAKLLADKGNFSDPTAQQIKAAAYEIYLEQDIRARNAQASKVEGSKLREFETKEEAIAAIESGEISVSNPEAVIDNIKKGAHGFSVDGGIQGTIIEAQMNDQLRNIATHEIGHSVTDKLLKNDPVKANKMAVGVIKGLQSALSRNEFKAFIRSATVGGKVNADEVLMRFLEMVADDQAGYREVKAKSNILGLFGATMQKEFAGEYDFDFKGETDIFNFFVGLGKKIASGELTLADVESASQNEILNVAEITKEAAQAKAEGIVKMSITPAAERAKQALDQVVADGFDPNNPDIYDAVNGMVSAQLNKYKVKGLEITDTEDAVSDVVSRLYIADDIKKFNPDINDSLYGYLNGRIKFRILDSFKDSPTWIADFGDVDVNDGLSGKEAQQVSVDPIEETVTIEDTPKYKNLIRRRVVSPEVLKGIKDKIKPIVRVLKKRMDEQVSKNVTVKPWVAALRKDLGKQIDIVLKKEMGGKKDGQLRRFLLQNKAAILENMTTTWLMTAMPNAIQKKVDGAWTSDWKGKKIDRETVGTDLAGRTSGAELVRRLPKAASKISDADFLATVIDASGNPIRGRKESLAKAMAEELGFDLVIESLNDQDSEIRKALESNQELLGVEIADNFVASAMRDFERGNVKMSNAEIQDLDGAISAFMLGDMDTFATLMNKLPKIVLEKVQEFISDQLVGVGFNGFKSPLKNAKYPENITDYINTYLNNITNKKNIAAIDELLETTEALVDIIDPEVLKYLTLDTFGINYNYGDKKRNARAQLLSDKIDEKRKEAGTEVLNFNPADVRILQGGSGLLKRIATNVLNKDFNTVEEKKAAIRKEYGAEIDNAVVANKAALEYILDKLYEVAESDPSKIPGILRLFEGQTNMGQSLRGLTGLSDIEIYAKSQGAYYNTKTKTYYNKLDTPGQRKKLKDGEIIVNKDHPLYSEAVKYIDNFNKKSKKPSRLKPVDLLNFKGEHALPSAKMWFKVADIILNNVSKGISKPDSKPALKTANRIEVDALVREFDQQLNSKLASDIQDDILGSTSEAGDLRLNVLSADMRGSFYETQSGIQTLNRAKRAVQAVITKTVLDNYVEATTELDSKGDTKMSSAENLSGEFNNIIERKTGVESYKTYSEVQAKMRGAKKGKFKFFIAPGADDFRGLVNYAFAGKGKQGETDMKFFEEKLLNPYFKGIAAIESARQAIRRDYTEVKKAFKPEHKMMEKKIGNSQFTHDQAVRVYLWEKQGTEIPGVSKRDLQLLRDAINKNPELKAYADAMLVVSKRTEWIEPSDYWTSQTILSDLNSMTEKIGRKKYLEEFIETSDAIFTDENLNKIEALYGSDHRAALEDSLYAMKNGSNRPFGKNKQVNKWLNWINGSTGAIMFFNRRSALLQMLSFTNFTNWTDNNPLKQAAAFANQKQYWSDFAMIFNSDKLKERRSGLKTDVSESEIANAVANGKGSPAAALNSILKLGFTPTQIADSFAIATGGAMFYRNRVNSYLKEGMSKKEAEDKAFLDFSKRSDEAQQSSDPALVSMQQRSVLGRLVLAFANTPMQYTRLMKKAGQDLINGRGSFKENMSKIAYYGVVQNFIFSSLQSALFALAFDDDDEEGLSDAEIAKKEEYETSRVTRVLNGMMDTVLRGSGVYGAVASVVKNTILEYRKQEAKGFLGEDAAWLLQILNLSPPIGSKVRKIYSAARTRRFEKDTIAERGWALTADGKLNLGPNYSVLGSLVSGIANVPLDRIVDELRSVTEALDERNKAWQRIALAFGWKTWDVGALNEEGDLIKAAAKVQRKEEGKVKAAETRAAGKKAEAERYAGLTMEEKMAEKMEAAVAKREKKLADYNAKVAALAAKKRNQ